MIGVTLFIGFVAFRSVGAVSLAGVVFFSAGEPY